jgi:hypothetical protein
MPCTQRFAAARGWKRIQGLGHGSSQRRCRHICGCMCCASLVTITRGGGGGEAFHWKNPSGYTLRKLQRMRDAMPNNTESERGRGAYVWMAETMMLAFNLQRKQPPPRIPALRHSTAGEHKRSMFSNYLEGVAGPTTNHLKSWLAWEGANWRGETLELPEHAVVP